MQVPGHSGRGSGLAVVVVVVAVVVVVGRGVVPTRRFGGAGREGLNDIKAFSFQDKTDMRCKAMKLKIRVIFVVVVVVFILV